MRSQLLIALGALALAAAGLDACASIGLGGFGDASSLRARQSPLPLDQAAIWRPQDRLYRSVTVDYVGGVNARRFKPVLESSLDQAGLLAPTPTAARYALQINAVPTKGRGSPIALADYRLLNRQTNKVLFEQTVDADSRSLGGAALAEDQRMAQSITRFVIQLGQQERVAFSTVVPCLDSAEVLAMKASLTARGVSWRTDDCRAYRERKADDGLRFPSA